MRPKLETGENESAGWSGGWALLRKMLKSAPDYQGTVVNVAEMAGEPHKRYPPDGLSPYALAHTGRPRWPERATYRSPNRPPKMRPSHPGVVRHDR